MKILVLGSGAREHALLRALSRDPAVSGLVCAPGNAGTTELAENRPVVVDDGAAVVALAREVAADLVVVGPEVPLVAGVADALREAGIACFGPSAAAARIEGSKSFAKDVMRSAGVATAEAAVFNDAEACAAHLAAASPPYVVKADGLAAGKGVHVGSELSAAQEFAREVLAAPGSTAVVEAFLDGPEVSLFALSDGTTVAPLLPAQDFKRVGDGDTGPNTGGMGAYAPLPWLPAGTVEQVQREVLQPVVDELRRRGTPFAGLLYAGLVMTSSGPQVIEFNCRFGDPETQVVLALLETPLAGVLNACATGDLAAVGPLQWRPGAAVTVVVAAEGYPASPTTGDEVVVGKLPEGVDVLHAGTRVDSGRTVSAGGRVLSVTARADTLESARDLAYKGVGAVHLRGGHWRTDIAQAAVEGRVLPASPGPAAPGRALRVIVVLLALAVAGLLAWQAERGWDMTRTIATPEAAARADADYRRWLCLEAEFRSTVPDGASIWISDEQPNLYYQRISEMSVLGHRVTPREDADVAVRIRDVPAEVGCTGMRLDVTAL